MDRLGKLFYTVVFLSWIAFLPGCATEHSKRDSGTVIGALIGGLLGAQTGDDNQAARVLVGAALGGLAGRTIGRHMDENDRKKMAESLERSEPGGTTSWTNQKTGNAYEFTPGENYTSSKGYQCREFVQEAIVNGKREKVNGTACKEPNNGQWSLS